MGHQAIPPCRQIVNTRIGWTAMEDKTLSTYVNTHGEGKWKEVSSRTGLMRTGKSCRLRWLNYLKPDIKRGNISREEDDLIRRLHKLLGNRWSLIAGRLPGRTDNEIKNYCKRKIIKSIPKMSPHQPLRPHPIWKPNPNAIRTKARRCNTVVLLNEDLARDKNVVTVPTSPLPDDHSPVENSLSHAESPLPWFVNEEEDWLRVLHDLDIDKVLEWDMISADVWESAGTEAICGSDKLVAPQTGGGLEECIYPTKSATSNSTCISQLT